MKNITTAELAEHRYNADPFKLYGIGPNDIKNKIVLVVHDLQAAVVMSLHNKVVYITDDEDSYDCFMSHIVYKSAFGKDDAAYLIQQDWTSELKDNLDELVEDMKKKFDCCIMNPPYSQGHFNGIEWEIINTVWPYINNEIVAIFPINSNKLIEFEFKENIKTLYLGSLNSYFTCSPRKDINRIMFDKSKTYDTYKNSFASEICRYNVRKKLLKHSEGILDFNIAAYFRLQEGRSLECDSTERLKSVFLASYEKKGIQIENAFFMEFSIWPGSTKANEVSYEECLKHKNDKKFVVGVFETKNERDRAIKFTNTKVFKFINNQQKTACYRLLNFDWNSDEDIYKGIGLTKEEIAEIEKIG